MTKKSPLCFSEWRFLKPDFYFHVDVHTIEGSYENHRHTFPEFFFVVEGNGIHTINGKSHVIKPGTFTLIMPYQIHSFMANKGEIIKLYNCSMKFDSLFVQDKTGMDLNRILFRSEEEATSFVNFNGEAAERIKDIFEVMLEEFEKGLLWDNFMCQIKVSEILVLFDRERTGILQKPETDAVKENKRSIWEAVYYIHNHYNEDISLSRLAKHLYTNPSYLSSQFKKHFGKSFLSFLNEIRVLHACSLLSTTDSLITQIAFDVGFKSYSSFCRVFMHNKKISAAEYRKQQRQGAAEIIM